MMSIAYAITRHTIAATTDACWTGRDVAFYNISSVPPAIINRDKPCMDGSFRPPMRQKSAQA